MTATATKEALARYFKPLRTLPAWGCSSWYGTWLRLQFGTPTQEIIGRTSASSSTNSKPDRYFLITGDYELWVEMARWKIIDQSRRLFHSNQSRLFLLKAGAFLDGRRLCGVEVARRPNTTTFRFEGDVSLVLSADKLRDDDCLWHFYTNRRYMGLSAAGRLRFGARSPERQRSIRAGAVAIAF